VNSNNPCNNHARELATYAHVSCEIWVPTALTGSCTVPVAARLHSEDVEGVLVVPLTELRGTAMAVNTRCSCSPDHMPRILRESVREIADTGGKPEGMVPGRMQFELNPLNYVNAHTHGLWGSLWGSWILYVDGLHDARCSGSRPHSKCVFCYFSVGSAKRWYICRTDGCMQEVPLLSVFFSASIIRKISRIFPGTRDRDDPRIPVRASCWRDVLR
jgi:hypothetical protein